MNPDRRRERQQDRERLQARALSPRPVDDEINLGTPRLAVEASLVEAKLALHERQEMVRQRLMQMETYAQEMENKRRRISLYEQLQNEACDVCGAPVVDWATFTVEGRPYADAQGRYFCSAEHRVLRAESDKRQLAQGLEYVKESFGVESI